MEGKGRLQAVAEGAACGGKEGQEGLGLSYQVRQAAAKGRGTEGELGMGFQLQKAQFGFSFQGGIVHSLGIVFRRVAAFAACGLEGFAPGLEGFPFGLQGFQQVEEALLGFQGVGASVRMQEFELVLQLGDIRSNGHHFVFALWKRGNMPPPLGGGGLRSFFFAAVRPIGLGSSFIFLRCPEEKRTKKKGAPEREKNSAYGLKQLFPRRETQKTASSQSARYKGYMHAKQEKESGLWLLTAFPGAGKANCTFYPLYKGATGKSTGRSEFICKPYLFYLTSGEGRLTREKLSERSEFFSRFEAPFFW